MKIRTHTAAQFGGALAELLAPGAAWEWPAGGFGERLLTGLGADMARVETATQGVLDNAVETHRPAVSSWHISAYRQVAADALAGVDETMPRRVAAIGSKVGDRLWSSAGAASTFPIPLFEIDHLIGPARVGSKVGERIWGHRSRAILRVRYYRSVVNPAVLWAALSAFKQAHVFLWFEDISGAGGSYAQN